LHDFYANFLAAAAAAVYSRVSFGVNMDEKNVVTDVRPGSAAANAGVRIGHASKVKLCHSPLVPKLQQELSKVRCHA